MITYNMDEKTLSTLMHISRRIRQIGNKTNNIKLVQYANDISGLCQSNEQIKPYINKSKP